MNIINQDEIIHQTIKNMEEMVTSIKTKIEKTILKVKEIYHKKNKKLSFKNKKNKKKKPIKSYNYSVEFVQE